MTFECKLCNYLTVNKTHYTKHVNTKKHKLKLNITDKSLICLFCNKLFKQRNSYYRHINNNSCNINKITIDDNSIINRKPNNKIHKIDELVATVKNLNNNVNFAIKSSSNLINYLMKNYKDVEPVKKLTHDDCDKLIKDKYNNIEFDDNDFDIQIDIINTHKNKNFDEYICDLILSIISNEDQKKQKIWNTDATRLNYAIKLRIDLWHNDVNGFNFKILIIRPITDYISNLLNKYMEHLYDIQDKIIRERPQNKVKIEKNYYLIVEALDAYDYLKSNDVFKRILKNLAPKLRFHNINIKPEEYEDYYNFDSDDEITEYDNIKKINKRLI